MALQSQRGRGPWHSVNENRHRSRPARFPGQHLASHFGEPDRFRNGGRWRRWSPPGQMRPPPHLPVHLRHPRPLRLVREVRTRARPLRRKTPQPRRRALLGCLSASAEARSAADGGDLGGLRPITESLPRTSPSRWPGGHFACVPGEPLLSIGMSAVSRREGRGRRLSFICLPNDAPSVHRRTDPGRISGGAVVTSAERAGRCSGRR